MLLYKNASTYVTERLGVVFSLEDLTRDSNNGIRCLFIVGKIQQDIVTLTIDDH
jgi:hypothetical protein